MTDHHAKHFTLDEANRTLTVIAPRLERLHQMMSELEPHAPPSPSDLRTFGLEGGQVVPLTYLRGVQAVVEESGRLAAGGLVVRDLRKGLIDFPAVLDGREIFLCWQRGEEEIAFYHERDAGFSGRQPLPADLT
jgi:hypothetical protein